MTNLEKRALVLEAWNREKELLTEGKGTADWPDHMQKAIMRYNKVVNYVGRSISSTDPTQIQFLFFSNEYMASCTGENRKSPYGVFDPESYRMMPNVRSLPVINLTDPSTLGFKNTNPEYFIGHTNRFGVVIAPPSGGEDRDNKRRFGITESPTTQSEGISATERKAKYGY